MITKYFKNRLTAKPVDTALNLRTAIIKTYVRGIKRPAQGAAALPLLVCLALLVTGCGPGFPIMTSGQEQLVSNVDTLMKENSKLKRRVSEIEESGAASSDLEDTRISLADLKSEMGKVRDEFSFLRTSLEENELAISQLKSDTESTNEMVSSITTQLTEISASFEQATGLITSLTAATESNAAGNIELKTAVLDLKTRLDTLEESIKKNAAKSEAAAEKKSAVSTAARKKKETEPKKLYAKGLKETRAKDYSNATKTFKTFLSAHPDSDLADNAQYWLGEIFYDTGEYERAILEFDKVITKYPKGDKRAAATLKQGFSFEHIGALKESRVLLKTVIELYPKSAEAAKAKKRLKKLKK